MSTVDERGVTHFRFIVSGSRDWTNRVRIGMELFNLLRLFGSKHLTIVVGDYRGVDRIVTEICDAVGITCEVHHADWKLHGRAAGPLRNREMIESGAGMVLAFKDDFDFTLARGIGGGTEDCARQARKAGMIVHVFNSTSTEWTNVP